MKTKKVYRLHYINRYTTEDGWVDLSLFGLIWNLLRGYYKDSYGIRYHIFSRIVITKTLKK
jgi:hypothetical protein